MAAPREPVAVLGAGSWGTALAIALARAGGAVRLWGRTPAHLRAIAEARENRRHLPGHPLPEGVLVEPALERACAGAAFALLAVPSVGFGGCVRALAATGGPVPAVVWATKGFDREGGGLLDAVARAALGAGTPLAVLSGPTFAAEIAAGLPAAVTVAADPPRFGGRVAERVAGPRLRVYTTDDLAGVQVGGAVKNVLAIAAGIADGMGFGANTRAALVTRGLAELVRLGEALGGRRETLVGLSGLGDLVLTCTDDQSRNRRFGLALGRGAGIDEALAAVGQVVEGREACRLAVALARRHGVELPIAEQVHAVLEHGRPPAEAVDALLRRAPRAEGE